jgi:ABC-2 type transport system permease protein
MAFLRRDWQMQVSYRFSFVLQFFGVFFNVFVFYFLSLLVGPSATSLLEDYGGDYFAFVLIGLAFSGYFGVGLRSFASNLRDAQTTGTLEAMLLTPTRLSTIILSSGLYDYGYTTIQVIVYLVLGAFLFGAQLNGNVPVALLVLALTIVAMTSMGIIAASFIMVLKRGDPVTWIFNSTSLLLGGVYYPVQILPDWLQSLSLLLPITYSLEAMRQALLNNASLNQLLPEIIALVIFCVLLVPLSLLAFRLAVRRARIEGSLAHY